MLIMAIPGLEFSREGFILGSRNLSGSENFSGLNGMSIQGTPLGIDTMYLVLADRNMQVRFGLKVVW